MSSGEQYIPLLQNISLFHGVSSEEMQALLGRARLLEVRKRAAIVTEGEESDTLYVVLEGSVRVFTSNENGKELTLRMLGAGDYFGELAVIDGQSRSASVVAETDCRCLVLRRPQVMEVISHSSQLALNLINMLTRRVRDLTRKLEIFGTVNAQGRVAHCLLDLGEANGDGLQIKAGLTHKQIGEMTGCSREMVSRIMKEFENAGYIIVRDRAIHLPADGIRQLRQAGLQ